MQRTTMSEENLKEKILEEMQQGRICYRTIEGVFSATLESFTQQPLEGMLYDLNRDRATILAFLDDPKWTNDLALTRLLEYYYNRCQELEKKLKEL